MLYNLNSTNQGFNIAEYKNISSKSTLQPRTKYKNTKMETCLQGLLPGDIKKLKTYITAKIQTLE